MIIGMILGQSSPNLTLLCLSVYTMDRDVLEGTMNTDWYMKVYIYLYLYLYIFQYRTMQNFIMQLVEPKHFI